MDPTPTTPKTRAKTWPETPSTTTSPTPETEWDALPGPWLTITAFHRELRVSRRTVYNWLQAGKLLWRGSAGGPVRVYLPSAWTDYQGPRRPWVTAPGLSVSRQRAARKRTSQRRGGRRRCATCRGEGTILKAYPDEVYRREPCPACGEGT